MTWKHVLIGYLLMWVLGIIIIWVIPSPPLCILIGDFLTLLTAIEILYFIYFFVQRAKLKRRLKE